MVNLLNKAKQLTKAGWSIIPIITTTKRPAISWLEYQKRIPTDAELETWFTDSILSMAVITGAISGLVVLDDDRKKHGLPELNVGIKTLCSKTGSGGHHHFFKYTKPLNSTSNSEKRLDVKADGGYVIIPPSVHINGGRYEWENAKIALKDLPEFPEWIEKEIYDTKQVSRFRDNANVVNVSDGNRNDAFFNVCLKLLGKSKRSEWETFTIPALYGINNTYKPPLDNASVETTIKSAQKYVLEKKENALTALTESQVVDLRIKEKEIEKKAITTGYRSLDKHIKGFIPHSLYVLSAFTSFGKTTLCCNFAERLRSSGKRVLFLAFETGNKVIDILASIRTKKQYSDITKEDLVPPDSNLDFITRPMKIEELMAFLEEKVYYYDLVIIDHIDYFITGDNEVSKKADLMKVLARLTKEAGTPILAVAHTRKSNSALGQNKTPSIEDIKGSASIFQDATDVLMLHRNYDEETAMNEDSGKLFIKKTKAIKTGFINLEFHPFTGVITEDFDQFYKTSDDDNFYNNI